MATRAHQDPYGVIQVPKGRTVKPVLHLLGDWSSRKAMLILDRCTPRYSSWQAMPKGCQCQGSSRCSGLSGYSQDQFEIREPIQLSTQGVMHHGKETHVQGTH